MPSLTDALTRRVVQPILAQLRQGTTPEKIALSLGLGMVMGVFPTLGVSSVACVFVGAALGLNQPVLQLANWMVAVFQVPLMPVFLRLGELLWGAEPLPFDFGQMMAAFEASPTGFFAQFGVSVLHAISAWAATAPLVVALLYPLFLVSIRRLRPLLTSAAPASGDAP